jgi:hypothetical protein
MKNMIVAATFVILGAGSASALSCSANGVVIKLDEGANADAIRCNVDGNDVGNKGEALDLLNGGFLAGFEDDWEFVGKSDDSDSGVIADNGSSSGDWSFTTPVTGVFAITLKAAPGFSAYAFNIDFDAVSGKFDTALAYLSGGKSGKGAGLSHLSLFKFTGEVPDDSITGSLPLPAGAWLMLSFIGGFGVLRRLKARAAA